MAVNIRVNGLTTSITGRARKQSLMAIKIRANGLTARSSGAGGE
jgi:hypothetical protein